MYYDYDYVLDDDYGDEDQNDLMRLILSYRGNDEETENEIKGWNNMKMDM